jgi:hypothetical protein
VVIVPAGKRLVIEYASAWINSGGAGGTARREPVERVRSHQHPGVPRAGAERAQLHLLVRGARHAVRRTWRDSDLQLSDVRQLRRVLPRVRRRLLRAGALRRSGQSQVPRPTPDATGLALEPWASARSAVTVF